MIETDLSGLLPSGFVETLGTDAVKQVVDMVAANARDYWVSLAEDLTSTRSAYINGIQPVADASSGEGGYAKVITLVGQLANALENGQKAYDMHDTLLGPNVPVVKRGSGMKGKHEKKGGGFYRTIPFRPQVPGSDGLHGKPMGNPYVSMLGEKEAAALGKRIYEMAKMLSPTTGMPGGKIKWGQSLQGDVGPRLKESHHSPIYKGVYRQQKTYKGATQNSYVSFRNISTGSPGWRRKETPGLMFAEQVKKFVESTLAPEAFESMLREVSK